MSMYSEVQMTKREIVDTIDDIMDHVSLLTDITDELEIDEEDKVPQEISLRVDEIVLNLKSKL